MPAKRAPSKSPAASSGTGTSPALTNTLLIAAALSYGFWLLVARGHVSWPPTQLLSSAYTLAGCVALVGPIVLLRSEGKPGGLGTSIWMTGGMLIWIFDLAAVARGDFRLATWATPLDSLPMGLTIFAVLIAGWRAQGGERNWSWTNVTGWVLGLFWVLSAAAVLVPARSIGLVSR
jgi:hypothetical protein